MPKQVMSRQARDNRYLHKDFHGALSVGIDYLEAHYGEEAVRQYLRQFAKAFYGPLTEDLRKRGLVALKEHFARIYELEGGNPRFRLSESKTGTVPVLYDELVIELDACPAVAHMRAHNYPVARLFYETTRTLNKALCEGTPFAAQLLDYDPQTGRGVQRFSRRPP
jgi:hypothetical protein